MVFRRHKALWQVLVLFIIVGITLRFSYNYYKENEVKLKAANVRHHELLEERNRIGRELENALESKNTLELTLRTKTQSFAEKKKEWDTERDSLQNEANKAKATFDALDSEYTMLKANHEDLKVDYEHMKKNFDRLKEDHTKLDSEHRKNFDELKEKNENIISALQKQVEHYQKQDYILKLKVDGLQDKVTQYQTVVAKLQQRLSGGEKGKQDTEQQVRNDEPSLKVAGKETLRIPRLKRRTVVRKPNLNLKPRYTHDSLSENDLNKKQFVQDLGKLAELRQTPQEEKKENNLEDNVNNLEVPKAGKYTVDVAQEEDGRQQKDTNNNIEKKDENNDNIEVINGDGKDEHNFNLDEQPDSIAKERQALLQENEHGQKLERVKRDFDDGMNDDENSDDEEIAVQERENNDNVVEDDTEENDALENPDHLLKGEERAQDGDELVP